MVLNVVSTPLFGHLNPCFKIALELRQSYGYKINILVSSGMDTALRRAYPELSFDSEGISLVSTDCLDSGAENELFARVASDPLESENDFLFSSFELLGWTSSLWPCYNNSLSDPVWRNGGGFLLDVFTAYAVRTCEQLGVACVVNNPSLLPLVDHILSSSVSTLFYGTASSPPTLLHRVLRPSVDLIVHAGDLLHAYWFSTKSLGEWLEGRVVLTNSFFGLEYPRDLPPNVIMTGPLLSLEQPAPAKSNTRNLPASITAAEGPLELASWLDSSSPIVFASFGTLALLNKSYCRQVELAFYELALAGRDQFSFLLKGHCTEPSKSDHSFFRVERWLPAQEAVLAHPNVRVFISHCGVNSVHEAVAAGLPVLCLPQFAEQLDMAQRLVAAGAGLYLPKYTALRNISLLREQVLTLLRDPAYLQASQRLAVMARLPGGVKRAAQLVDHYLQHPDAVRVSFSSWPERKNIDLYVCFSLTALALYLAPRFCRRSS